MNQAEQQIEQVMLVVPGKTRYLELIRRVVSGAAHRVGFGEEALIKIVMAVDEACANIIEHGYGCPGDVRGDSLTIDLSLLLEADRVTITIRDTGKPFCPTSVEPLDLREYFTHGRGSGLGIYIMRTFVDEIEHSTPSGGGNRLKLVKYLA